MKTSMKHICSGLLFLELFAFPRYLYWVDWGLSAYIGRMGMDGSDETELHNDWIGWPNGLTIDYGSNVVYWVDAHLDYIA